MLILKSVAHPITTVITEPLGEDGSVRLTPLHGERSGDCFVLDADAAAELAAFITGLRP
jgi:hypothetical protein